MGWVRIGSVPGGMGALVSVLSGFSGVEFDFSPGAQVPLFGMDGQTAATQALSSAAYRDGPVDALLKANPATGLKPPKLSILEPNLGEAFARAVQLRMLGGARKETVQCFGTDPQTVVEHCLAANRIRQARDVRLTMVMAICGLLFLPGVLVWLIAFQLRRWLAKAAGARAGALSGLVITVAGLGALLLIWRPPVHGLWVWYVNAGRHCCRDPASAPRSPRRCRSIPTTNALSGYVSRSSR
jgi:hypothetical protein